MKAAGLLVMLVPVAATSLALATLDPRGRRLDAEALPYFIAFIGLFALMGAPLVLEYFWVRHTFDDQGLDYRTPWTDRRTLRWADVVQVKWGFAQWLVILDAQGRKFRFAPTLSGLR